MVRMRSRVQIPIAAPRNDEITSMRSDFCYTSGMSKTGEHIPGGVKVVAFNWGGTVVDSIEPQLLRYQEIARHFYQDFTLDEVREVLKKTVAHRPTRLRELTDDFNDLEGLMHSYYITRDRKEYASRTFEGTAPTLHALGAQGLRLSLLTGLTHKRLEFDSNNVDLNPFTAFSYVQTPDTSPVQTPDGAVFDGFLEHFSIGPEELLYVGDKIDDYNAAKNAGTHFLGVTSGMASAADFNKVGACHIENISHI